MNAIETLQAFGRCLERGDAAGAVALFAADATYAEPPKFSFVGRQALHAFIADFAARHSDVSFTLLRSLAAPDDTLLAAEWRWAYMRNADDTRRVFEGISFVEVHDGQITSWRGFSALMGE